MPTTSNGMYVEERGDGDKIIVLLPGFGCSIAGWRKIADLLEGYRCLLVDLPGHAGSVGAEAAGDMRRMAATVFDACVERGLDRFAVAGQSLGGAIGVRIALDHPDHVEALIGVMPWNAAGTSRGDPVIEGFCAAYQDGEAVAAGVEAISQLPEKTTDLLATMPTVTEQMWKGWLDGGAYTSMADELATMSVPTMYLLGGKDTVVSQDKQLDDIRSIPGSRLVLLADLGHLAVYEAPERVAEDMTAFLRRAHLAML